MLNNFGFTTFIGTVSFNAYHGCLKCHVIGEYDSEQRNMTFPRTDMPRRTDYTFRQKLDTDHHKLDSPLLALRHQLHSDFFLVFQWFRGLQLFFALRK